MPSVGASGILGIALEASPGTYLAPTKFIPFDSESIKWTQENTERRPIRNSPALLGMIRGDGHVESRAYSRDEGCRYQDRADRRGRSLRAGSDARRQPCSWW